MVVDENSVCRKFRRTGADGKEYNTKFYNLEAVIAVGFRTNSERAIVFRQWAASVLKDFRFVATLWIRKDYSGNCKSFC